MGGQITDKDLEEHELDLAEQQRSPSKQSVGSVGRVFEAGVANVEHAVEHALSIATGGRSPSRGQTPALGKEAEQPHAHDSSAGILIDAVPESLVIGILINKAAAESEDGDDRSWKAAAAALPFVIGVFLSNLPESMSSSGSMKAHGMRVSTILMMWLTTTVLTALGAVLGAVLFPPNLEGDSSA